MKLTDIYQALNDSTRLRILHLLAQSPLCVQHLQEALQAPQVMVSKHLLILKASGLVECQKIRNWRLYRLPPKPAGVIRRQLDCLLACIREERLFEEDLERLKELSPERPANVVKKPKSARAARAAKPVSGLVPLREVPEAATASVLEDHLL